MRRAIVVAVVTFGVSSGLVISAQAAAPPGIHKTGSLVSTTIINKGIIVWPGPERK